MRRLLLIFAFISFALAFAGETKAFQTMNNPILDVWHGNFGGVPAFDKVVVGDFKPALETAMSEKLLEIEKIANNPAPANFENTIIALERSGAELNRSRTIFDIWSSNLNTGDFSKIEEEITPKLAALSDKIIQNAKLFQRIQSVYENRTKAKLNPEQARLTELYYQNFVLTGAKLGDTEKARMSVINQKLAELYTRFSQNLLGDEKKFLILDKESDLSGVPQSMIDAYAGLAEARNAKGKWAILNTRSSVEPFLTYSDRRDLREKVWTMFVNRGDNGDDHDNNKIISQIVDLRREKAALLGFPTYANWKLADKMAKTPEKALALMEAVWKPAVNRVHEEVLDMQAFANKSGAKITIEPWDYRFYMERVRKEKYDLDQNEVKPYLQLEKLREAMFWVAGELFNFEFTQLTDVPVFHPDVRVFKVTNRKTGKLVGLWYFDPYARDGKRSGAWMNEYRAQQRIDGKEVPVIVSNNSNFIKGKPGEPILISWDDAETLFHEFGHALHGLNSNVTYPSLAGTSVATDYVEFPSQLLEHWVSTPEVLNKFAINYKTGKPIPQELVDKIKKAATFNQGFATLEYLSSALVDMKLHMSKDKNIDIDSFERNTLTSMGMPKEIVMRHRLPQFGHLFSDDGYAAGYYSYLWSDVITADAFGAFTEAGGPYDKKVAERLQKYVFSVGNTIDQGEAYRMFRGRDPKVEALMIDRGFLPEPAVKKNVKKTKGKK